MRACELAKLLYPSLSKNDFIQLTCPDILLICDKIECKKDKNCIDTECIDCWNREVKDARVEWLLESKKMCDFMC